MNINIVRWDLALRRLLHSGRDFTDGVPPITEPARPYAGTPSRRVHSFVSH